MLITRVQLKNWRNFRSLDLPFRDVTYILGPNASGKSNLLDVFRFLRDVAKPTGGGLQSAVAARGGVVKLRCLHARRDPEVEIIVTLAEHPDGPERWRYRLAFKPEGKGAQRLLISAEQVWREGELFLDRPDANDEKDELLKTQTHLEQIQTSASFRELVEAFSSVTYLHLVPQLLKHEGEIGGRRLADDPFGQGFLDRIAKTQEKTRNARLRAIGAALKSAVPNFDGLKFKRDDTGQPHLEARYIHYRPNAGWQSEEQFSDGTLRLLALLWMILDGNDLLLMEEPEISLNVEIVRQIPAMLQRMQRGRRARRQFILTTHSEALLENKGIDGRSVLLLESRDEGYSGRTLNSDEMAALEAGLSVGEVVLPKTRPAKIDQLTLAL